MLTANCFDHSNLQESFFNSHTFINDCQPAKPLPRVPVFQPCRPPSHLSRPVTLFPSVIPPELEIEITRKHDSFDWSIYWFPNSLQCVCTSVKGGFRRATMSENTATRQMEDLKNESKHACFYSDDGSKSLQNQLCDRSPLYTESFQVLSCTELLPPLSVRFVH